MTAVAISDETYFIDEIEEQKDKVESVAESAERLNNVGERLMNQVENQYWDDKEKIDEKIANGEKMLPISEREIVLGLKHEANVREYARQVGHEIGLDEAEQALVDICAIGHDSKKYSAEQPNGLDRLAKHADDSTIWTEQMLANEDLTDEEKARVKLAILTHQGHPFIVNLFLKDMEDSRSKPLLESTIYKIEMENPEVAKRKDHLTPLTKEGAALFLADLLEKHDLMGSDESDPDFPAGGAADKLADINAASGMGILEITAGIRVSMLSAVDTLKRGPERSRKIIEELSEGVSAFEHGYDAYAKHKAGTNSYEIYTPEEKKKIRQELNLPPHESDTPNEDGTPNTVEAKILREASEAGILSIDEITEAGNIQREVAEKYESAIDLRFTLLHREAEELMQNIESGNLDEYKTSRMLQYFPEAQLELPEKLSMEEHQAIMEMYDLEAKEGKEHSIKRDEFMELATQYTISHTQPDEEGNKTMKTSDMQVVIDNKAEVQRLYLKSLLSGEVDYTRRDSLHYKRYYDTTMAMYYTLSDRALEKENQLREASAE